MQKELNGLTLFPPRPGNEGGSGVRSETMTWSQEIALRLLWIGEQTERPTERLWRRLVEL